MGYISKYDRTFISFINLRYKRYRVDFKYWDDYAMWLYYMFCKCNTISYYKRLEQDLWDFSDWQTGSPRENEKKNDDWKKMEKDKYHLYKNDKYVEYLKRNEWKNGKR